MRSSSVNNYFPLPQNPNPPDSKCFMVEVPNDIGFEKAFFGCLFDMAQWINWMPDEEHLATVVARRCKIMWEGITECAMLDVRQSPDDPCILQKTNDGGAHWTDFADISSCVNQIYPPINNPPGRGQPGENTGGSAPPVGVCFDYNLQIDSKGTTLIPLNIQPGFTITLIDGTGAWQDGSLFGLADWQCFDGFNFVLGICGGTFSTDPADPIPTARHMELILRAPDNTYHTIRPGITYEVPGGMPAGNFLLLANDSAPSDNVGNVQAHLRVCNGLNDETIAVTVDGTVSTIDFHTVIGHTYTITVFDTWWLGASFNTSDCYGDTVHNWPFYRPGLDIGVQRQPIGGAWEYLDPPLRRTDHIYTFTRAGDGNQWNFRWLLSAGGPSGGGPFHVRVQG